MRPPKATIPLLLAMFATICSMAMAEESVEPSIVISGTGKDADGQYFATTRKYGLLKEGDSIATSNDTESFRLKVIAIDQKGIRLQKLAVKKKSVQPPPPEPTKATYKYRDPFWPIGYTPQGSKLLKKDQEKK